MSSARAAVPLMVVVGSVALAVARQAGSSSPAPGAQPVIVGGAARGKATYDSRCAECHGAAGKGDGPASFLLMPRPRDFTLGRYKIRTTESGSVPTDEDLGRSVQQGLHGSAMPGWKGVLSDADVGNVVAYIKALSPRFATDAAKTIAVSAQVRTSPESVRRGTSVYDKLQCGKCHGTDGRGAGAAATTFEDDWGQPLRAADLTEPWSFRGGAEAADVFMRFRSGMSGTPMPSFKDAAGDAEMWDLANYVLSLARKPVWQMSAAEVSAFYTRLDAEAKADPVKHGRYLADTMGCAVCHTPIDRDKRAIPGLTMAGGLRISAVPFGDYPSGNLTSDKDTGLGNWTNDQIKAAITRGVLRDGTRMLPYPMDWASYASLRPDDLNALVAYLRSIPPVSNRVPAPSRTFLPVYLWGKFKMLVLGSDPPMIFYPGNVGSAGDGGRR